MTYLEILSWARKGLEAEKAKFQAALDASRKDQRDDVADILQECLDGLNLKTSALDILEGVHEKKY